MAGLITVAELLVRPGFENIDTGQAQALIDDASALVREAARGELDTVESPDTPPAVVAVMANMIRRGFNNPTGLAQESLGDYSYSVGASAATLYLTSRERKIVRRAAGVSGLVSQPMTGSLPEQPSDVFFGFGLDEGIEL